MTNDEALIWSAYIHKHGSLNTGLRVEHGAALIAYMSGKTVKKTAKVEDFMPKRGKPKQQSDDEMLAMFMKAARVQNGNN